MKTLNKISLALVIVLVVITNTAIAQITGTATVAFGATYTYTYNDGGPVNNITWSTTRGQVVGQGGSGNNYTVDITWTSAGTTSLIAYENGSQIASKTITVNSCTIGKSDSNEQYNAMRIGKSNVNCDNRKWWHWS